MDVKGEEAADVAQAPDDEDRRLVVSHCDDVSRARAELRLPLGSKLIESETVVESQAGMALESRGAAAE